MCWNWQVSIISAIALFCGSLFLKKRREWGYKYTNRDHMECLIILNLAFVQLYEFGAWLTVHPADADISLCPKSNFSFTVMLYIHGAIIWPPLINWCAMHTTQGKPEYFLFTLVFGCVYFVVCFFDMLYSHFKLGIPHCATDGGQHLNWDIARMGHRMLPNGYDWFLFSAFPLVFYRPKIYGWTVASYLIISFAIPFALVSIGQTASLFCWLGFGVFLIFLSWPYASEYIELHLPSLMAFDPFPSFELSVLKKSHSETTKSLNMRKKASQYKLDISSANDSKTS